MGNSNKTKKIIIFGTRMIVSAVLFVYIIDTNNIKVILQTIRYSSILWILAALVLNAVGKTISAYRWQYLLLAQEIKASISTLIGSLLVGHFFNIFLPTTVGGDIVRVYDMQKLSKKGAQSFSTVVVERMMGIFALALFAVIGTLAGVLIGLEVKPFILIVLMLFFISIASFIILFYPHLTLFFVNRLSHIRLYKLAQMITKVNTAFTAIGKQKKVLLVTFIYSAVLQVNVVLHYYFIGLSLHLTLPLIYYFIIFPLIIIILMLPISINGIGLRENVHVVLLGIVGISSQDAIAFSWIVFGIVLLHGLVGGVVYALRR